jgi:type IV pilus assembly protein PilW
MLTTGHPAPVASRARGRGFSLIELMIAMTLSLILLAGAVTIFVGSRATYETTDRLSRIQENGRFALDSIVRDLRSAGYVGCSRNAPLSNLLEAPDDMQWDFELAAYGLDAQGDSWAPALDSKLGIEPSADSDLLIVRMPRGDFEPVRIVEGSLLTATTDDIPTEDTATPSLFQVGDIVQISDCNARAIFQVTSNAAGVIGHVKGGEDSEYNLPGNATDDLGYAFTDTAELVALESAVYFIAPTPDPESATSANTSLFRLASGRGDPEELASGVENMQLLFGELDGGEIIYRRADEIDNWQNVQTVRIALLVRSTAQYGTEVDRGTYELLDTNVQAPGDRYLRQVFTTTVGIRNNPT